MGQRERRPTRTCAGGCGALVTKGRCTNCARALDYSRGTPDERGYDGYWRRVFRPQFIGMLVEAGIAPTCGAVLEGGPQTTDSECRRDGLLTVIGRLELDHAPAITEAERLLPPDELRFVICNANRIQILCSRCHRAKTLRERMTRGG